MTADDCTALAIRDAATLDELAATINAEHRAAELAADDARAAMSEAIRHAIAAGEALTAAKSRVPPRTWGRWLDENVELSRGSAYRYMRIAHYQDHLASLGERITLKNAGELLAGLPDVGTRGRKPNEQREEAQRLAAEGVPKAEIAALLGVDRKTVHNWTDPAAYKRWLRRKNAAARRRREAQQLLAQKERDEAVRRKGGTAASAYALLRRTATELDRAISQATAGEERDALRSALRAAHQAEDEIVRSLKIGRAR